MHSHDFHDHLETSLVARPLVEQAKGVLTGARCASPEEAFEELRHVALVHQVELHALASALVDVAAGRDVDDPLLRKIVWQEWSELLPNC